MSAQRLVLVAATALEMAHAQVALRVRVQVVVPKAATTLSVSLAQAVAAVSSVNKAVTDRSKVLVRSVRAADVVQVPQ